MKKILVYMATYNGERYIQEQLESILAQENVHVDILIADDCSSDHTCQIIEGFRSAHVKLVRNPQNKGYRKNFMDLIRMPLQKDYDYFALSDQDDVWLPGKLAAAVQKLEALPQQEPNLYCSNLKLVDGRLIPLGSDMNPSVMPDRHHFILQNICTGCTAVFSPALRELLLRYPDGRLIVPHDTILARVCLLCGNFVYDENAYILYRQHGNNAIGANSSGKLKKYWNALRNRQSFPHSENLKDIWALYQKDIHPELAVWLQPLLNYKQSFFSTCKLLVNHTYGKQTLIGTLIFKAAIVLKAY